ncbi:MAG TPA: DUF5659 domain-containing protein [Candidatus Omnitrophota bacterium]|nr:DUF5659 domain-containing protein [Candidatus Omnitrophota bacterium]
MNKQPTATHSIPSGSETTETNSIYEAAYLLCRNLKLCRMDRSGGSKVTFVFQGKDATKKANEFFNGAKVGARAYSDAVRSLKDRIFKR